VVLTTQTPALPNDYVWKLTAKLTRLKLLPSNNELIPAKSMKQLQRFVASLDRWRQITNLISDRAFGDVWERHIIDSAYIQWYAKDAIHWLDIGSGAGFPGIVIGVLLSDRPNAQIHCVESDSRKCAFLRSVVSELQIPVKIHNLRAELVTPDVIGRIDAVTSRAVSSIERILTIASPFLAHGATALLPRGNRDSREVETLDATRYAVRALPNPAHRDGLILVIKRRLTDLGGGLIV
jgi:16S rRNA (guanine527-N7)-methyltransferase